MLIKNDDERLYVEVRSAVSNEKRRLAVKYLLVAILPEMTQAGIKHSASMMPLCVIDGKLQILSGADVLYQEPDA